MANFNKVLLMGNLTRDPELKYLPSGTAVCEFGLAVNRRWNDQQTGEKKEQTCFVDLTSYGRQAETLNQYMKKGRPIFIEGRLDYAQWETPEGQKRSKLRVVVENFQFVGTRDDAGGEGAPRQSAGSGYGGGAPRGGRATAPQDPGPYGGGDQGAVDSEGIPF